MAHSQRVRARQSGSNTNAVNPNSLAVFRYRAGKSRYPLNLLGRADVPAYNAGSTSASLRPVRCPENSPYPVAGNSELCPIAHHRHIEWQWHVPAAIGCSTCKQTPVSEISSKFAIFLRSRPISSCQIICTSSAQRSLSPPRRSEVVPIPLLSAQNQGFG